MTFVSYARLVGLVPLYLVAAFSVAYAQDAGPQADIPPAAAEAPAPAAILAQATVPAAAPKATPPAAGSSTAGRIDLDSIPDPKKDSVCTYKLKQGVKQDDLTSRVSSVQSGLSYSVEWSSNHEGVTFPRYSRGGNPWDDYRARYRPQFQYPATLGAEWQVLENYPRGNGGFIKRMLIARVTEVGSRFVAGGTQPVRVVGVRLEGRYEESDPGGNGTFGSGRMWEELVFAPDLHCFVTHKGAITKWNGSSFMSWELTLVGYDPGL